MYTLVMLILAFGSIAGAYGLFQESVRETRKRSS